MSLLNATLDGVDTNLMEFGIKDWMSFLMSKASTGTHTIISSMSLAGISDCIYSDTVLLSFNTMLGYHCLVYLWLLPLPLPITPSHFLFPTSRSCPLLGSLVTFHCVLFLISLLLLTSLCLQLSVSFLLLIDSRAVMSYLLFESHMKAAHVPRDWQWYTHRIHGVRFHYEHYESGVNMQKNQYCTCIWVFLVKVWKSGFSKTSSSLQINESDE